MLHRFILASFCLICALKANGQQSNLMNFVPVSPSAAALGKFGNIPVSYYNGLPSIEIPLYTIEQRQIKIPISINYHSSGVKVSEIASLVGLGWALNAGGTIVRNERGLADDILSIGYLNNGKTITQSTLNIADYYEASKGWLDLESDEYLFNFLGVSGKFLLDKQANAFITPHQAIKIYPLGQYDQVYTPGTPEGIRGWKIVNTDGAQYFFQAMEVTEQPLQQVNNTHNSAWHLTKIISADKNETIFFEYEDAPYTTQIPMGQTKKELLQAVNTCGPSSGNTLSPYSLVRNLFNQKRLRKIIFSNGFIEFFPSVNKRCDLPGEEWLDKIVVSDNNNHTIKEIVFKYGYMIGSSIVPLESVSCTSEIDARLMLLSVKETGKSPYTFDYIHDKGLPSRYSMAQDHWGYFNRVDNGIISIVPSKTTLSNNQVVLGPEREANFDFGKQGLLNKLTYPTGGITEFEYEPHRAVLSSLTNFPEYAGSYDVATHPDHTIQIDYGRHNLEVASFDVNYLQSGTSIYFKTENFIEASGSYFIVENSNGVKINCLLTKRENSTRFYSCPDLPNGSYKIKAMRLFDGDIGTSGQTYPLTILSYDDVTAVAGTSMITIGGARIKKIIDTDLLTGNINRKEFDYSLGYLVWGFKYRSIKKEYLCWNLNGTTLTSYTLGEYELLTSNSNYPLSNTQGAPVGYKNVIVREYSTGAGGEKIENGYTSFSYTDASDYPDFTFHSYKVAGNPLQEPPSQGPAQLYSDATQATYQFPYAPPVNNDWRRGLLLNKSVMKRNENGTYSIVQNELNTYSVKNLAVGISNVKCGVFFDASLPGAQTGEVRPINAPMDEVLFSFYDNSKEFLYLKKNISSSFDGDRGVTTETEYFYDNDEHLLVSRIGRSIDHGEKELTVISYPQDYASGTSFIDAMVTANNISAPIEKVVLNEDKTGVKTILKGELYYYSNDGKGLLESMKSIETAGGINISGFKFSNRETGVVPSPATSKTAFIPHTSYVTKVSLNKYQNGAVIEARKPNDLIQSYFWDYNSQYLTAAILNSYVKDIAYSGFETASLGSWNITGGEVNSSVYFTGLRSYSLVNGNSLSASGLSQGKYKVSYWSQNGALTTTGIISHTRQKGSWTYYEHSFDNVTSVSLTSNNNNVIDDIRLYPEGAQITTYTYKPLVGISSISDSNGNPIFYEYDSNGRLKVVKDGDGKIVNHFQYHYKGQ
jgi:hypothetical protein